MRRNYSNNVNEKDEKSRPEIRRGKININIIIIVFIWKKNAEQLILENRPPDKKGYWR